MSFLGSIFGQKKTPEEQMKEYKRMIDRAVRELDRERTRLQTQEKKLVAEIKKTAQQNQMGAVKIMAKDLVRTRAHVNKFYNMRAQLQAVGLRLQTLKSTAAMAGAMKGVTKALTKMNEKLQMKEMADIMKEFSKQSEIMDAKEEMMGDTIDDVMGGEDEEEESDTLVRQVLDEIGIKLDSELVGVPGVSAPAAAAEPNRRVAAAVGAGAAGGSGAPRPGPGGSPPPAPPPAGGAPPAAPGGGGSAEDEDAALMARLQNLRR
eukprot:tig00020510_g9823.t1